MNKNISIWKLSLEHSFCEEPVSIISHFTVRKISKSKYDL